MNSVFRKIKNFFEDFFLDLYNNIFSSKYVRKGKCKKCGACCRNIMFSTKDGFVKSGELFKQMQNKYKYYRNFKISGVINDKQDFKNGALTFECKHISKSNRCKIYSLRPIFCRRYPDIDKELIYNGVTMLNECGYSFDVDKKFDSYLK